MPQVVPAQMLIAESHHDFVPMRCIPQDGGGDASAARAGEQAGGRIMPQPVEARATMGRISSMIGTVRRRLPLVPCR